MNGYDLCNTLQFPAKLHTALRQKARKNALIQAHNSKRLMPFAHMHTLSCVFSFSHSPPI